MSFFRHLMQNVINQKNYKNKSNKTSPTASSTNKGPTKEGGIKYTKRKVDTTFPPLANASTQK